MSNLITMSVTGRLGRAPKLNTTPGGSSVLNFSIASSRSVKRGTEYENETVWFDVAVWGARAEGLAKVLGKGDLVSVSGSFWPRTFKRRDGGEGVAYEVQAHAVNREALSPDRAQHSGERGERKPHYEREPEPAPDDDQIPF
jgi:single-strand DNA-binding protein